MAIILSSGLPWQPRRRQISCRSAHCYLLLLLMPNLLLQPPTLFPTHYHYNIVPTTYYLQDQPTISLLALLLMQCIIYFCPSTKVLLFWFHKNPSIGSPLYISVRNLVTYVSKSPKERHSRPLFAD